MAEHPELSQTRISRQQSVVGRWLKRYPQKIRPETPSASPLLASLGMTETGGPHTAADDPYALLPPEHYGTFGRALPGVEHLIISKAGQRIKDQLEGEILVRGLLVMDGIYKRERNETFTPDGWYPTGDQGWFDSDDLLHFTGRGNAMIKTSGSNVSPDEVESTIRELSGIRDVFVIGLPHPVRGEEVAAVIVVNPDSAPGQEEIQAHTRAALSSYKVPRHIRFIDESEVPLLPTGKVNRSDLGALFDERSA